MKRVGTQYDTDWIKSNFLLFSSRILLCKLKGQEMSVSNALLMTHGVTDRFEVIFFPTF